MARNEHKKVLKQLSEAYQSVYNENLRQHQFFKKGIGSAVKEIFDIPKDKPKEDNEEPKRDKNREFADSLWSKDPEDLARRRRAAERVLGKRRVARPPHLFTKGEDNEEPKRGISGYEHKPDALAAARQAGAKHKPYVSSFVGDGGKKIFAILGSDGKIVHKTHNKQEAHQWLKDNYENI